MRACLLACPHVAVIAHHQDLRHYSQHVSAHYHHDMFMQQHQQIQHRGREPVGLHRPHGDDDAHDDAAAADDDDDVDDDGGDDDHDDAGRIDGADAQRTSKSVDGPPAGGPGQQPGHRNVVVVGGGVGGQQPPQQAPQLSVSHGNVSHGNGGQRMPGPSAAPYAPHAPPPHGE